MTIGKPARRRNPLTGKYPPTKRTLAFKNVVSQRRAEVAKAAQAQRRSDAEKLNAAVTRAEHAVAAAQAREAASLGPNAAQTPAPAPDTPGDSELGAQDNTKPPPE